MKKLPWAFVILCFAGSLIFCVALANSDVVTAKSQEAGCVQFAKVGMWDVYHCVDANGFEFEANSAGMMIPAEK